MWHTIEQSRIKEERGRNFDLKSGLKDRHLCYYRGGDKSGYSREGPFLCTAGRDFGQKRKKAQRPGCRPARQSDTDEDGAECCARDAVGTARVPGNFDTNKDVKLSLKKHQDGLP